MKKLLVLFITISSLILPGTSAVASVKPGKSCLKHKSVSVYAGKKFTCVKSGKKLVWNKGVTITLATAVIASTPILLSPDPSPTTVPVPVVTATPEPTPIPTEVSKTLTAHEKVLGYLKNSSPSKPEISTYISENAKQRNYKLYLTGVEEVAQLWQPLLKSPKFSVVIFTEKDSQWVDEIQTKLMGPFLNNPREQLQSYRLKDAGCNIYGFYLPGVLVFCVKDDAGLRNEGAKFSALHAFGHEYFHLVGMTSPEAGSLPVGHKNRVRACWIEEGGATFWGISMAHISSEYTDFGRTEFIKQITTNIDHRSGSRHGTFIDKVQNSNVDEFVSMMKSIDVTLDYCITDPLGIPSSYFLGMIATEYLVSSFGVETVMSFNKDILGNTDWKTSFAKHFNMTTEDFYRKLFPYMKERIIEFDIIK
jgi:hypothetical protein